ncbi:MAG TPA: hypothetical protein VGK29_07020 [Paludibaculum sp.]
MQNPAIIVIFDVPHAQDALPGSFRFREEVRRKLMTCAASVPRETNKKHPRERVPGIGRSLASRERSVLARPAWRAN